MGKHKILDKDKLQVIYYLNVQTIDEEDIMPYVEDFAEKVKKDNDGSVIYHIIPCMGEHEPQIEFYWPPCKK